MLNRETLCMKRFAFALLAWLCPVLLHSETAPSVEFNDALTQLRDHGPAKKSNSLAFNTTPSAELVQRTLINHLKEIKESGQLSSSIASATYWPRPSTGQI